MGPLPFIPPNLSAAEPYKAWFYKSTSHVNPTQDLSAGVLGRGSPAVPALGNSLSQGTCTGPGITHFYPWRDFFGCNEPSPTSFMVRGFAAEMVEEWSCFHIPLSCSSSNLARVLSSINKQECKFFCYPSFRILLRTSAVCSSCPPFSNPYSESQSTNSVIIRTITAKRVRKDKEEKSSFDVEI